MPTAAQPASGSSQRAPRVSAALTVAVVAISFAGPLFRKAEPTPPLVAAGIRLTVAALVLAPWVRRAAARGALPARVWQAAALGGVAYAVHFGAWIASLELTSVASSVALVTATPLLLALAGLATGRDRPTSRHGLAVVLALAGICLIAVQDASGGGPSARGSLLGDGLALLGAAAMAAYMLIARRAGAFDVAAFMGVAVAVGAVLTLGTAAALGQPLAPPTVEAAGWLAAAALVPQLVGHSLLTWALRHTAPVVVGIATVGEPVGAALLGWVWLGEVPTGLVIGGGLLTLAGVVVGLTAKGARGAS